MARTLAERLRAIDPDQERDAADRAVRGCAVLRALLDQAYETHRLHPHEARAIVYTLGLIGARSELATRVLQAGRAHATELHRARRGLPNPTGCKRLRKLPGGPDRCRGCTMPPEAHPYPTPVLFALGEPLPAQDAPPRFAEWLEHGAEVVQEPLDAIGEALARIEARLHRLEAGASRGYPAGARTAAHGRDEARADPNESEQASPAPPPPAASVERKDPETQR